MRWKRPKEGQRRIKSQFLLFPKTIRGETRWLEFASWEEAFFVGMTGYSWWGEMKWIDKGDKVEDDITGGLRGSKKE